MRMRKTMADRSSLGFHPHPPGVHALDSIRPRARFSEWVVIVMLTSTAAQARVVDPTLDG